MSDKLKEENKKEDKNLKYRIELVKFKILEAKFDDSKRKHEILTENFVESLLGDFLIGGLLVSGIFVILESLELERIWKIIIGVIFILISLLIWVYLYFRGKRKIESLEKDMEESITSLNKLLEELKDINSQTNKN